MDLYHECKHMGIKNLQKATTGLILSDNHEDNKELLRSIIETCRMMLRTEDIQIAYETCDIEYLSKEIGYKYD